ncbi:hypothetical protein [Sphaerospermopsis sp. LEGE 08334]|uniref:hypothetical protein n=1 Tax=Sphaerospermopsis sp. LEGE 08334 TaxID=1828651 RepID=UPI001D151D08|nr:hypothetical protein [Sphaerospermopsis sp. LEGE 08334]
MGSINTVQTKPSLDQYRLESCLKLLRYPIIADEPLQLLFMDIYHAIRRLVLEIKTPHSLTSEKVADITFNIDAIFTLLNSHLVFLFFKSSKSKIFLNYANITKTIGKY